MFFSTNYLLSKKMTALVPIILKPESISRQYFFNQDLFWKVPRGVTNFERKLNIWGIMNAVFMMTFYTIFVHMTNISSRLGGNVINVKVSQCMYITFLSEENKTV